MDFSYKGITNSVISTSPDVALANLQYQIWTKDF